MPKSYPVKTIVLLLVTTIPISAYGIYLGTVAKGSHKIPSFIYIRAPIDIVFKFIFVCCDSEIMGYIKRKVVNFFDIHFGLEVSEKVKNMIVTNKIDPVNVADVAAQEVQEPRVFTVVSDDDKNKRSARFGKITVENIEFTEF